MSYLSEQPKGLNMRTLRHWLTPTLVSRIGHRLDIYRVYGKWFV